MVTEWLPLHMEGQLANTTEQIRENIVSALARDYIPFNALIGRKTGAVAIVGSGPSLKKNWRQLKRFKGDIIACNAACQFLLEKGITPTYMFCFDADRLMLEFMTPHKDITYLLASRCHPKAFDMVKGCKVVCWHAGGDLEINELLGKHGKYEPMVAGGGAAVTRAMIVALPMGYTEVHLYGADSSFAQGDTHIRQSTTKERRIKVKMALREFETAPWMAKQLEEFKVLAPTYRDNVGARFIVHGDGLIPHAALVMGFETDLAPRVRHFARRWKWKAETLWQNL